ncbi:NADPH:quinone oxidoreductase family protein [Roseovarius sp. M141]|uniref:NADPH:quinone oxidoreductase family protein n=1 Tax=Roseovarius sp. M141 TaxID=2583806 RepID=UPI0020CC02F5|nr:NADPH:quinone oxidoreductase family protein [Roseovarius sp. M141]MCQ0093502.1 NADPH:quinone oxidoreductase family protein [Roseovarius sp. M141]
MRALRLTSHDVPPELKDCPLPEPACGQIRLRIHACGLNFADLLMIKGSYQDTPALPFTLGMEVAGIVDAHGDGVDTPTIGTRVAVYGGQGGLAEYGCFDADRALTLPDSLTFEAAAAFQIAYGTSHLALAHRARLAAGETLLVLGAAGGVGLTAVEIGKAMGARVIACARGAGKLEAARAAGADHLIDAETDDIRTMTKDLGGADVVYDPVGGDQFTAAFRACRPEARILTIGFASGEVPQIPANHLLVKNLTVMGLYWGGYLTFAPDVLTGSLRTLLDWAAEGQIAPRAHHTYPLERTMEGLELLRTRRSTGKVVVTI